MHIRNIFKKFNTTISFEFFPPKNEQGALELYENINSLAPLNPSFVSVTYGAGGSTREHTHNLVVKLKQDGAIPVVSHLTCVGHTKDDIRQILDRYSREGVDNIMVLRGDPPKGSTNFEATPGGFKYSYQMVEFIKKNYPHFGIGVAGFPEGHPETPNRLKEMDYLKQKVDAGADYICTQLFFNNKDFYDFRERSEYAGIKVPIIAGIMPISSRKGLVRMADLALGTRFPAKLMRALDRADDDKIEQVGVQWAVQQVMDLLDNDTKGIHLYTLNKSYATRKIFKYIGLSNTNSLQKIGL